MRRHINIPIFVVHLGCPHQCSFCNQRTISGQAGFDIEQMVRTVESCLATAGDAEVEIAFFGGSFTGIDRALMTKILRRVQPYLQSGRVSSLRCSTRPDYINEEILDILEAYGMKTVELGIQSMSDKVLSACHRGHTAEDSARAARLLVSRGFSFVGQMMVGLPGSTAEDEIETAERIAALGAVGARVYPTVVFRKTPLCLAAEEGRYTPLSLTEAVERAANAVSVFRARDIPVIRVGLQANEAMTEGSEILGGPVHPALGELVESALYRRRIEGALEKKSYGGQILRLTVARGATSALIGQNKQNKTYLCRAYGFSAVTVTESAALCKGDIIIKTEKIEKTEERKRICT